MADAQLKRRRLSGARGNHVAPQSGAIFGGVDGVEAIERTSAAMRCVFFVAAVAAAAAVSSPVRICKRHFSTRTFSPSSASSSKSPFQSKLRSKSAREARQYEQFEEVLELINPFGVYQIFACVCIVFAQIGWAGEFSNLLQLLQTFSAFLRQFFVCKHRRLYGTKLGMH